MEESDGIEVLDKELHEKHLKYMKAFRGSLAAAAIAAGHIRDEKTYVTDGYTSFTDFMADELGVKKTNAFMLAAERGLFELMSSDSERYQELINSLTTIEQLRPIYKMDADRQVKVLLLAVEEAGRTRAGRPQLTGKLIEEVAEKHFNWKPEGKSGRRRTKGDKPEKLIWIEKRLKDISEIGLTPEEAIEAFGPCDNWDHFENAVEWLRQVKRLSEE